MMGAIVSTASIVAGFVLLLSSCPASARLVTYPERGEVSGEGVNGVNGLLVEDLDFSVGSADVVASGPSRLSAYLNFFDGRDFIDIGSFGSVETSGAESIAAGFIAPNSGALIVAASRDNLGFLEFLSAAVFESESDFLLQHLICGYGSCKMESC